MPTTTTKEDIMGLIGELSDPAAHDQSRERGCWWCEDLLVRFFDYCRNGGIFTKDEAAWIEIQIQSHSQIFNDRLESMVEIVVSDHDNSHHSKMYRSGLQFLLETWLNGYFFFHDKYFQHVMGKYESELKFMGFGTDCDIYSPGWNPVDLSGVPKHHYWWFG